MTLCPYKVNDAWKSAWFSVYREWRRWFGSSEPERTALPGDWQTRLEALQRLIIVRCLRPDRVIPAASRFVAEAMDAKFVESVPLDWGELLASSKNSVPLLFVLSGVDPTGQLMAFAASRNTTVCITTSPFIPPLSSFHPFLAPRAL